MQKCHLSVLRRYSKRQYSYPSIILFHLYIGYKKYRNTARERKPKSTIITNYKNKFCDRVQLASSLNKSLWFPLMEIIGNYIKQI